MKKLYWILILVFSLLVSGCGLNGDNGVLPTASPPRTRDTAEKSIRVLSWEPRDRDSRIGSIKKFEENSRELVVIISNRIPRGCCEKQS